MELQVYTKKNRNRAQRISGSAVSSSNHRLLNENKVKTLMIGKVENILKGGLDSISSPSPSVRIQIMGGKFA